MEFCNLICFEQFSEGDCPVPDIIEYMANSGRAGRFVHFMENGFPQWMTLCALEEALVDNRLNKDWLFVVGTLGGDDKCDKEVKGWLEYWDGRTYWVVIPHGPLEKEKSGNDISLFDRNDFDEIEYTVTVFSSAADDSAMQMNKILRDMGRDIL